jgi:hypothetical protein
MNGYDHWKATNPDDEWLGPEPDQDDEEPENQVMNEPKASKVIFVGEHIFSIQPVATADGDFYRVIHVLSGSFIGFANDLIDGECIAKEWVEEHQAGSNRDWFTPKGTSRD